jgi:CheY-like chemotaxis protein
MAPRIAWIEDDSDIIGAVVTPLERAGYRVDRYRTAAAVLAAVDEVRQADLLLIDILIPVGDTDRPFDNYVGRGLLRFLREECGITAPALAFTVVANTHVHDDLVRLGIEGVLSKPILPSELKRTVDEVLAGRGGGC